MYATNLPNLISKVTFSVLLYQCKINKLITSHKYIWIYFTIYHIILYFLYFYTSDQYFHFEQFFSHSHRIYTQYYRNVISIIFACDSMLLAIIRT